nr:immunoglobulin light chain junction region [Mus musculus]NSL97687.1 immunoglobulin light chain junction region [Mus musculus]NSL97942.1 immunoglobulin light chain junction region [Mus musculus]NSL99078.1 immunoglobulin light chain junction region [Mus musculus]NSL99227.1 immunoglobulin light chain junction region [Mus musculus]
CHQYHRSPLTF